MRKLSIVLPLYNEEANFPPLIKRIRQLIPKKYRLEFVLVNDGSGDNTEVLLHQLARKDKNIKGISFYKNFGHQAALQAGVSVATGDAVITMDADFQHPPELLPLFVSFWEKHHDVVMGQKKAENNNNVLIAMFRKIGYQLYRLIGERKLIPGVSDFRLMDRKVVDYLKACSESRFILRGLVMIPAANPKIVPYKIGKRRSGHSGYNFFKLLKLVVYSLTSFSLMPLRLAGLIGISLVIPSSVYLTYIFYSRFILKQAITQGWTALMFVVVALFGFLFIYLGILAEYISTIYEEVKHRPSYLVKSTINL